VTCRRGKIACVAEIVKWMSVSRAASMARRQARVKLLRHSGVFFGPVKTGLSPPVSAYALALPCHVPGRYDL
jgi:hypothetical protein